MKLDQKREDLGAREKALNERISQIESFQRNYEQEKASSLASSGPSYTVAGNRTGSFESKMLNSFGVAHVKQLLEVNANSKRFVGVDTQYKLALVTLKETLDTSRYIAQIFYNQPLDKGGRDEQEAVAVKHIFETNYGKEVLAPMLKAFGTGVSGGGAEWIPTAISAQFIEEFELEKRVAMAFREMPMATNPFELSVQKDSTIARIATEGAAMTGANFGTDVIQFSATKLSEFYPLPEELNEDSAPPILQIARSEVSEAQIRARETLILNGDDTAPHMDDDTTNADDARKVAKGLRRLAIDNSANGAIITFSSAVTTAKLDEMKKAMGKFSIGVRDLAYIFSPATYHQAVELDEVTTVEKFGGQATILSGALAAFRGVPVMISEFVREDLDATGVNSSTPGNNIKGAVHLVNMRRFWVGMRRPIRVRVMMDLADQDRWLLSSYQRLDFKGHAQSADEVSSVVGVDVTL